MDTALDLVVRYGECMVSAGPDGSVVVERLDPTMLAAAGVRDIIRSHKDYAALFPPAN